MPLTPIALHWSMNRVVAYAAPLAWNAGLFLLSLCSQTPNEALRDSAQFG